MRALARANIELLQETAPASVARGELAALRLQADELGALVTDIIELARDAEPSAGMKRATSATRASGSRRA